MQKTKTRKTRKPAAASMKTLRVEALRDGADRNVKGGVVKLVDKSSPKLYDICADGKH